VTGAHGLTEGPEGTGQLFHRYLLSSVPTQASFVDVGGAHFSELAANMAQPVTYDVLGGPAVPATDTGIFVPDDTRYPTEDDLATLDGIMVSGSDTSVRYVRAQDGDDKWVGKIKRLQRYLRYVIDNYPRIKVIGSCFGHQIISFATGSAVDRNPKGWEVGPTDINLNKFGKKVFKAKNVLVIQEIHEDRVLINYQPGGLGDSGRGGYGNAPSGNAPSGDAPPTDDVVVDTDITPVPGLQTWGSSDITDNQGVIKMSADAEKELQDQATYLAALEKIHIFTCQGHPEFTKEIMTDLILDYKEPELPGGIPAGRANAALARNTDKDVELDSELLGLVSWQMLKGAHDARIAAANN
jgi:GMP synthase-like glutamine amidotransferase